MDDTEFSANYDRVLSTWREAVQPQRDGTFYVLYPDAPEYATAWPIVGEAAFEAAWRERNTPGVALDARFCVVEYTV